MRRCIASGPRRIASARACNAEACAAQPVVAEAALGPVHMHCGTCNGLCSATVAFGVSDLHGTGVRLAQVQQYLEPRLARELRTQAKRLGVGPATVFHAAWALAVACTSARAVADDAD